MSKGNVMFITEQKLKELRKKAMKRKMSPMEKVIMKFLRNNDIVYKREFVHMTLKNPKTGYPLYIDFYIPKYNLAVEYDGKQHFIDKDKERLREQRFRDNIKNIWCQANNIDLLRIKYLDQKDILKILQHKLNEKGFNQNRSGKGSERVFSFQNVRSPKKARS